eukprot:TRINITY_DN110918_c0_g1_i1.p1 TRINITY_DN110918_c0_g1~~TRINITY_DN110918_c0_g1_i1.p1  ORF type:complete len:1844 (-),score=584.39 TRINITY_DN110918_c0_g1_i1:160-5043(-)
MAVRQTGAALLSAHSVQETVDMAMVAHVATLLASVPFVHFFDGMRTSHEIQKVTAWTPEHLKVMGELLMDDIDRFRSKALHPNHPSLRGSAQSQDIYFQNMEAANQYHANVPKAVRKAMKMVEVLTGRTYDLFQYYGHPKATDVIVAMGSGVTVIEELIDYYGPNKKVGVLKVHLFRPWSKAHFLAQLPSTCKRIAVLDRCKETGVGEPLFTDVAATLQGISTMRIIGGRYGLASKDFTTGMAHAVFENLRAWKPKHPFTVGIEDDVTHLSLPYPSLDTVPTGTVQCLLFGFGSDGTVGANKNAIKLISKETDLYTQGHFAYDALKAGGITCSHLRFGPKPIKGSYEISAGCSYLAIHKKEYVWTFHVETIFATVEDGAVFVLNSPWTTAASLRENLPVQYREVIVGKNLKVYNIDANSVALKAGMGKLINNIMQTVFFHLSEVMEPQKAIDLYKKEVEKTYKSKGPEVVRKNIDAIDMALDHLKLLELPEGWEKPREGEKAKEPRDRDANTPDWVVDVIDKVQLRKGDSVPVSKFQAGGQVHIGMTEWAKRGVAQKIPVVDMDKCTQCNKCSQICPHAVIRPFLVSPAEMDKAPAVFDVRKAVGGHATAGLNFRIQVSPLDCTGCEVCVTTCPDDALRMESMQKALDAGHKDAWDFALTLPSRAERFDKFTVRGSQFNQPLLEFSGACEGCGETPYAKLLTQLFGTRMIIANTTGCSSIWGGPAGWVAYTVDKKTGRGPAWGNSLFEDNAEYGLGMVLSMSQRRKHLITAVEKVLQGDLEQELRSLLEQWLEQKDHAEMSQKFGEKVEKYLEPQVGSLPPPLKDLWRLRDMFMKPSMWMMGGDGWANDIGFGGIDHVMALGMDVNVVVLDTEVYSNTGGQSSKATPLGSVAKFAAKGKRTQKKDLGGLMMNYQGVYVASCAMGANFQQSVRAFQEAEAHPGPSLVICYSPCIEHRTKSGLSRMGQDQKAAVDCGYWPLYRYDPKRVDSGENPFQLDSKTLNGNVVDFLRNQNRYAQLERSLPDEAVKLRGALEQYLADRFAGMKARADASAPGVKEINGKQEVLVLYGSETGTAEAVARRFAKSAKARGISIRKVTEMNDAMDLASQPPVNVVAFVATCGDGETPPNAHTFVEHAFSPKDFAAHKFAVFALGDKGYPKFCLAGKQANKVFQDAGAKPLAELGIGDACDEDGWETGYTAWLPEVMEKMGAAPEAAAEAPFTVTTHAPMKTEPLTPPGAVLAMVEENRRMTPVEYERDVRHFVLSNKDVDLPFLLGDAIGIYPQNLPADVDLALQTLGYEGDAALSLTCVDETASERLKALGHQRTTARQLLTEIVDIFGKPSRSFFKALANFANATEAKTILNIASSPEGGKFSELQGLSVTYHDIFKMFPSARPPIGDLLGLVPAIKYRLYSIANSSVYCPGKVELTIVINEWKNSKGEMMKGTSTKYIQALPVGARLACVMTTGTFVFPKDDMTPMVMAGLGTGIAPIRSFVQDRLMKKRAGKKVGPMVVFYGCRHEKEEFFYKEEWAMYKKEGVLTELVNAFSHDKPHYPPKMIFVNQKMDEHPELMGKLLGEQGGYFYMCGLKVAVPGIDKSLMTAMAKTGIKDTETWLTDMKASGRYSQESY